MLREQISVLAQALAQAGRPVTVLRWLSYGHSAGLVRRLVEHDGPLTHQHLDALPPSKAVHYTQVPSACRLKRGRELRKRGFGWRKCSQKNLTMPSA